MDTLMYTVMLLTIANKWPNNLNVQDAQVTETILKTQYIILYSTKEHWDSNIWWIAWLTLEASTKEQTLHGSIYLKYLH